MNTKPKLFNSLEGRNTRTSLLHFPLKEWNNPNQRSLQIFRNNEIIIFLKGSCQSSNSGSLVKQIFNISIHFEFSYQFNENIDEKLIKQEFQFNYWLLLPLAICSISLILLIKVFSDFPNICVVFSNPQNPDVSLRYNFVSHIFCQYSYNNEVCSDALLLCSVGPGHRRGTHSS